MRPLSGIHLASDLLTSPIRGLFRVAHQKKPVGAPPGTLVYTGPERVEPVAVELIQYGEEQLVEQQLTHDADFKEIAGRDPLTWINVDGLSDVQLTEAIGSAFGLHPLVLEDLVHTGQRAKVEEYDDYLFVVLRMLTLDTDESRVRSEQVGIVLGDGWVLSFQEREGDVWDPVRDRIRAERGRIRKRGADYLAYALIDAVVDHYFLILERMADLAEDLEVGTLENPTPETMRAIHNLRHEMLVVRRAIWPLREATNSLTRTESALVNEDTQVYLRDVYDHTVQVVDMAETLRDVVSGLMDLYISSVSNRMNEIMKVLTIMASVFIPLTFLAGIYGMNFEVMPELGIPWAYPTLLAIMFVIGIGLIYYFRKRRWL
jgi:magnesium transporter